MILDLYKPEQVYGTPNGGTTLLPFNGSIETGITYAIDDDEDFDLGSAATEMQSSRAIDQYGETNFDYTRPDRDVTFTVIVTGDNFQKMEKGVRKIQSILAEAAQYSTNSQVIGLTTKTAGFPYMLKYQPDVNSEPRFFIIKSGTIDTSDVNKQIKALNNEAAVPITLRVSYAAYGYAVWLDNALPNGTFLRGFQEWNSFNVDTKVAGAGVSIVSEAVDGIESNLPDLLKMLTSPTSNAYSDLDLSIFSGHVNDSGAAGTFMRQTMKNCADMVPFNVTAFSPFDTPITPSQTGLPGFYKYKMTTDTQATNEASAGIGWTYPQGTFGIDNPTSSIHNMAYAMTDTNNDTAVAPLGVNGHFIMTNYNGSIDPTNYHNYMLIYRYKDASNYCGVYLESSTVMYHTAVVAGVPTLTALPSLIGLGPLSPLTSYSIEVIATPNGDTVKIGSWQYGKYNIAIPAALKTSANNKVGFRLRKGGTPASANARVHDFTAYRYNEFYSRALSLKYYGNCKVTLGLEYRTGSDTTSPSVLKAQVLRSKFGFGSPGFEFVKEMDLPAVGNKWTRAYFDVPVTWDNTGGYQYALVRFLLDPSCTDYVDIRKGSLLVYPEGLDPSFVQPPVSEYVSQTSAQSDICVVSGLRGDLETNPLIKVINPYDSSYSSIIYQELNLGLRKQKDSPAPYFIYYNATTTLDPVTNKYSPLINPANFQVGSLSTNTTTDPYNFAPYSDFKSRQYHMYIYGSTTAPCGVGFGGTPGAYFVKPNYLAVPNATVAELPNTAGVKKRLDCGIVTIPPYNANSLTKLTPPWSIAFTATQNSGSSTINLAIDYVLLVPAEQSVYVDTREQGTLDFQPSWIRGRGLVIDSLLKETPSYYLSDQLENVTLLNPSATSNPVRFYPATESSPYPMAVAATTRRTGSNGAPSDVFSRDDYLRFMFIYCPAYEF